MLLAQPQPQPQPFGTLALHDRMVSLPGQSLALHRATTGVGHGGAAHQQRPLQGWRLQSHRDGRRRILGGHGIQRVPGPDDDAMLAGVMELDTGHGAAGMPVRWHVGIVSLGQHPQVRIEATQDLQLSGNAGTVKRAGAPEVPGADPQ
nr:hypothetical protein [Azohydromonas aeria]